MTLPVRQGSEIKDNPFWLSLRTAPRFMEALRSDYTRPARAQGLRTSVAGNPLAVGAAVLGESRLGFRVCPYRATNL